VRCELRLKKQLRTALFCVTMQHVTVISYQRFGTTDWSRLVFWILALMMGPIGCLKSLVINSHYLLHNSPEECGSHLLCGRSLKSLSISVAHGAQQSEIVPEYNGSLSCDRHTACS